MLSGALGSLASSGTGALLGKVNNNAIRGIGMIGSGGLAGGLGSMAAGGDFMDGFRNGLISSTLNHGIHAGVFGENVAMAAVTGKTRHLFSPDARSITTGFTVSSGVTAGAETGGLFILRGEEAGWHPYNDIGVGGGIFEAGASVKMTNLYYSGRESNIRAEIFYGARTEVNVGLGALVSAGVTYTRGAQLPCGYRVHGVGYSVGVGIGVSASINYGVAGQNRDDIRKLINSLKIK